MNAIKLALPWSPAAAEPAPAQPPADLKGLRNHLHAVESTPATAAPVWEAPAQAAGQPLTTSDVLARTRPPAALPPALEAGLLDALTRPLAPGETHHAGNARREQDLAALIIALSPVQALALARRLDLDRDDDAIAVALRRLIIERRTRLRALLRDPRRAVLAARRA